MGSIRDDVFLGSHEKYNQKLSILANLAQKEIWTFKSIREEDPFRILRKYFEFTYDRIKEEGKLLISNDNTFACMNTGLLTVYDQEIVAIFTKSNRPKYLPWYLTGFFKDGDRFFREKFSAVPEMADYFDHVQDVIYDKNLEIDLNINHIIGDNLPRFESVGYNDSELIIALLEAAKGKLEKKLKRNFKLALPFYYHNTETNDRKIQLLVPVYFPGSPVRLALVLDKTHRPDGTPYYLAITVLPVEWAYMNARLIVRPDEEWAKLVEEADTEELSEGIDKSYESC